MLKQFVHDARVDYASIKARPGELNLYLNQLAAVRRSEFKQWSAARKIAFLCNASNAFTLRLIIDHYAVRSIKDISGFFSGPWDQPVVGLFGETITLDTLEHKILRKDYDESRIHFALVCATTGCPPLQSEAFVDVRLDEQLNDQERRFLATSEKNRADTGVVQLSPIFKWYVGDFEKKSGSALAALKLFWPEKTTAALDKENFKIEQGSAQFDTNAIGFLGRCVRVRQSPQASGARNV